MGRVFFPLDERIDLLPGAFSPRLVEIMVRLGTIMPFEQVPELLVFLTGVQVTADTVRRMTERAGVALVAIEEGALAELERLLPDPPAGPARQQFSADGAMVPLVDGEWAEVRTVAIGTLPEEGITEPCHPSDITYFSRLCSAHDFIRQAALPCHTRGLSTAGTVVAVVDGADWLQELIDAHCPDAVRILDFPHAAGHLARAAQAAFGPGSRGASVWLDQWIPALKRGETDAVLTAIRHLPLPDDEACAVQRQVLGYLTKRRDQLDYAAFQQAGFPLGSGMVESANKLVVEARLKGSGMHWSRSNVTPMLALRGICCSGHWRRRWPAIRQELRRQVQTKRRARRAARRSQRAASTQETSAPPCAAPPLNDPPLDYSWRNRPYDARLLERARAKS